MQSLLLSLLLIAPSQLASEKAKSANDEALRASLAAMANEFVWTDNDRPAVVGGWYHWFSPDWGRTLEATTKKKGERWQFGLVRMNGDTLQATFRDKEV